MSEIGEAIQEGISNVGSILQDTARTIGNAIGDGFLVLGRISKIAAKHIRDISSFYFDNVARHTMGSRIFGSHSNAKFNWLSHILLAPVNLISVLSAFLVAPIFYNSYKIFIDYFIKVTNLALSSEKKIADKPNNLTWYQKLYSLPGVGLALILGGASFLTINLGKILYNSVITAFFITVKGTNLAIESTTKDSFVEDSRNNNDKRLGYLLGYPLGFAFGIVGFCTVGLYRVGKNTVITSWNLAGKITNLAFAKNTNANETRQNETEAQNIDKRKTLDKYLSVLGNIIGVVFGAIGFSIVGAGRIIGNSFISAKEIAIKMINLSLADESKFQVSITKRNWSQVLMGYPGVVIGFGISIIIIPTFILPIRIIGNSYLTAFSIYKKMQEYALDSSDDKENLEKVANKDSEYNKSPHQGKSTKQTFTQKYILGFPGMFIGVALGSISFITISIARNFGKASLKTAQYTYGNMINVLLSEKNKIDVSNEPNFKQGLQGFLGFPLGFVAGLTGVSFLSLKHIFVNSIETSWLIFTSLTNISIEKGTREDNFGKDHRSLWLKLLGFPGATIGLPIGILGFFIVGLFRIGKNGYKTSIRVAKNIVNFVQPKEKKSEVSNDTRKLMDKLLGSPGYPIGVAFGLIGWTGLYIKVNFFAGLDAFIQSINISLDKHIQIKKVENNTSTTRKILGQILRIPGFLIGGLLGLTCALMIGAAKGVTNYIKNNALSFYYFSGSLMNVAIGHTRFTGVGADNRSTRDKVYGGFGYVAATCTTGVIGLLYYTSSNILVGVALVLGVCNSLFCSLYKSNKMQKNPRFKNDAPEDEKEQKFKNLYGSLDPFGKLQKGEIKHSATGGKGALCFVRKSVTFNVDSMTERLFDTLLKAYRSLNDKSLFNSDSESYKTAIEEVKNYYERHDNCLVPDEEKIKRNDQIDELGKFVLHYLNTDEVKAIPVSVYEKHKISMRDTFFGRNVISAEPESFTHSSQIA